MQIGDFFGAAQVTGSVLAGTITATQILPENQNRTKVVLSADSPNEAWLIKLGVTQSLSVTEYTYRIPPSGNLVLEAPMYTGIISAVQPVAEGNLMITEFSAID